MNFRQRRALGALAEMRGETKKESPLSCGGTEDLHTIIWCEEAILGDAPFPEERDWSRVGTITQRQAIEVAWRYAIGK